MSASIVSEIGDPSLRDLPLEKGVRARTLLKRAILLRCPQCGGRKIYKNWFTIHENCPTCGYQFAREGGYFLGAYVLNLLAAEFIPIGLMVALLVWTTLNWLLLEAILIPLAVGLPLLFFPFAQCLWMALDLLITPENQR